MMRGLRNFIFGALALASLALPVNAAGTLPIVMQQQFNFTGCNNTTGVCGTPLNGGLLYFYAVGTVATPQNSFQDTGLSLQNPWPLQLDANGRVPPFYLADGSVHVRLTDSSGVVMFDYPSMLVIGPSSGGGGGSTVDPTTVLSTGDIKFRATAESLTGWVKLNGLTIGSATSGATGRANADTQNLFVYLWTNCPDAHCPVGGGRGGSAAADFAANKAIATPDWRARIAVGLDDMGATAAGRMLASNVTSGGGDGVTTPNATGGEANHQLIANELPIITPAGSVSTILQGGTPVFVGTTSSFGGSAAGSSPAAVVQETVASTFTGTPFGNNQVHNNMQPFMLGTWYIKL